MTPLHYVWLFFGFTGRVDRTVYFLANLFLFVIQLLVVYRYLLPYLPAIDFDAVAAGEPIQLGQMAMASNLVLMVTVFSTIALSAKRLHDIGWTGFIAVAVIFLGFLLVLVLCLIPGQSGPNRYGAVRNVPPGPNHSPI